MFSGPFLDDLLRQKRTRLALVAVCAFFAAVGARQLLHGAGPVDWLRGGGNILVWGGFAAMNLTRACGRAPQGLHLPVNVGILLVAAAWIVHS